MKHFSFKIILLCLVMPPIVYLLSMYYFERYLDAKYRADIEEIYIGDTQPLFDGSKSVQTAVNENIDAYLAEDPFRRLGVELSVTVITRQGMMLFPDTFEHAESAFSPGDPVEIAAGNYALLNEGLDLQVKVNLLRNTLPANLFLAGLIVSAALILYGHYRAGVRRTHAETAETEKEIDRLLEKEQAFGNQLDSLAREREALAAKFAGAKDKLEKEREKSERNEEDLIDEIVSLEKDLNDNLAAQEQQEAFIDELKEKVADLEKMKTTSGKEQKADISTRKRFDTLYKNTVFSRKAISGYRRLTADLKLKGEEVIQQLNADPGKVRVKRKVFGKKNRETVFEVIFGYKGRLYFRRLNDQRTEVLSIGTKNTQRRDLEFLDKL